MIVPATPEAVRNFVAYVYRRTVQMAAGGLAAAVAGIAGVAAVRGGTSVAFAALVVVGAAVLAASLAGLRTLRAARALVGTPAQVMDLRTWPYRSMRATRDNRVLVTLDRPGSINRTPLAEFRASWFTPGSAESPRRSAEVFGALVRGATVFAVADDGTCFIGRVTRTRTR